MSGRDQTLYYLGKISDRLGRGELIDYWDELEKDDQLIPQIEEMVKDVDQFETKKFNSVLDFRMIRTVIYCLVRDQKPRTIIETGVMHGLTSSFILLALNKNEDGRLISIDYPSYFESGPSNNDGYMETLPPNKEPGWIVPLEGRGHWDLRLGKSVDVLPGVFSEIDEVDIFFHDSEHTYTTMWEEMKMGWAHLSEDGLLICDNIDNNPSFFDFCRRVNRFPVILPTPNDNIESKVRFGIIKK